MALPADDGIDAERNFDEVLLPHVPRRSRTGRDSRCDARPPTLAGESGLPWL